MRYASATTVSVERSRAEIERILVRYGADQFLYARDDVASVEILGFRSHSRQVKFGLPMPQLSSFRFTLGKGLVRSETAQEKAWEQAKRQRWRALALAIKAKLEIVEAGITTFEEEFLPHLVLPTGETVGSWILPQVAAAYDSGEMPALLPAAPEKVS